MLLSAATALHVGSTSYSKAYVGSTQVWPLTGYTLTHFTATTLSEGDRFVLINPSSKTIVGNSFSSNIAFADFSGNGTYSGIPSGADIFLYTTTGCSIKYSNGTNVKVDWREYSQSNIIGIIQSGGESNICANSSGRIYGVNPRYGTSCFAISGDSQESRPHLASFILSNNLLYYIFKLTVRS